MRADLFRSVSSSASACLAPGSHLTADLAGCAADHPWMRHGEALREACLHAVAEAGLHAVGDCFHAFTPAPGQSVAGVTGVVLLAESHLAVHTWPELGVVTLDVFVCNLLGDNAARAQQVLDTLVAGFAPTRQSRQAIRRAMPEDDRT
jgi:S-adenosylmethionine decarboxylase proenzyme